ncbi:MAG: hypothetical protein Q9226_008625, partial [Calogaya cf. arnoldii]
MHCNICQHPFTTARPFNCAACAREVLYQPRVSLAHTLLEQEAAVSQSEQYLKASRILPTKASASDISKTPDRSLSLDLEFTIIQCEAIRHQTQCTLDHAKQLRLEADDLRHEIARGKARNFERRNDLLAARKGIDSRQAVEVGRLERSIAGIHRRWDAMHARTAESRLLLCREAANLYGLKKHSNRAAASASDSYQIGGVPIYNLRDLNRKPEHISSSTIPEADHHKGADPAAVTTVTASLAHLIHLVSHYLALRLPAEVILPHRDCPFPTILAPEASYATQPTPHTKATPDTSSSNDPSAVRGMLHASQRFLSKSLYTKKRLSITAKEDPQTYAAVIEGITLLAWNVAWLCQIQGLDVGAKSWEGICDVGANLWMLIAAEQAGSRPTVDVRKRIIKQDGIPEQTLRLSQQRSEPSPSVAFGQFSHGTVHSNLSTASGSKVEHGWRLRDPAKIIARVKQMLSSDRTGAGWEMLEGKEWESQLIRSEQPEPDAVVDASTVVGNGKSGAKKTSQNVYSEPKNLAANDAQEKVKGTSGWMKLK